MKKLLLVLFVLVAASAQAQAPNTAILFKDSGGTNRQVSGAYPLPVDAVVTVGSVTVSAGSPPSVASCTSVSVTTSAVIVGPLTNRQNISLFNYGDGEVWVGLSVATPAVLTGVPLPKSGYFSLDLDSTVGVSLISSETAAVKVLQTGH